MQAILEPGRNQADYARMPFLLEQGQPKRQLLLTIRSNPSRHRRLTLLDHAGLQLAPFSIDRRQTLGQLESVPWIIGQQAFDTQRHVFQTACRIDPRRHRKT